MSGAVEHSGLTDVQAAAVRLCHNGARYEMRRWPARDTARAQCWALWIKRPGPHDWAQVQIGYPGGWKVAIAWAADADAAFADLAVCIIYAQWDRSPDVMTDAEYARDQAELARL